jgi:hypothetical protein
MSVKIENLKKIAVLGIKLERCLKDWKIEGRKKEVKGKFTNVWGPCFADHFLSKYENAESMIWALDEENLELFIKRF